jgi:hypothetical protein
VNSRVRSPGSGDSYFFARNLGEYLLYYSLYGPVAGLALPAAKISTVIRDCGFVVDQFFSFNHSGRKELMGSYLFAP